MPKISPDNKRKNTPSKTAINSCFIWKKKLFHSTEWDKNEEQKTFVRKSFSPALNFEIFELVDGKGSHCILVVY